MFKKVFKMKQEEFKEASFENFRERFSK